MTITGTGAYETMRAHHRVLGEELARRADTVSSAAAEEKTIYPAAAAHADLAGVVDEMIAEHVTLSAAGARLAALTDGAAAAGQAQQIAGLFTAHAARENDILLPALLADEHAGLTPDAVTAGELRAARELARAKFACSQWTARVP